MLARLKDLGVEIGFVAWALMIRYHGFRYDAWMMKDVGLCYLHSLRHSCLSSCLSTPHTSLDLFTSSEDAIGGT